MLFDNMTEEEGMKFLRHILHYHKTGEEPGEDTERGVLLAFKVFMSDYDKDQKKYKDKCDRNRENILKRYKKLPSNTTEYEDIRSNTTEYDRIHNNNNNNNNNNNVSIETKEDTEETTAGPSVSVSPDYQNFIDWLNKNCTHLLKMNIPTEEEYQKLMEAADKDKKILTGKLLAMENNKDVPKTKRSIYRTCLEWLKRDKR